MSDIIDSNSMAVPRLLVSVKSVSEVPSALEGGVQVLDIKDPLRGSLGMAAFTVIQQICDDLAVRAALRNTPIPISVALGELHEWDNDREVPTLPDIVTFAKLGLSCQQHRSDWRQAWVQFRSRFDTSRLARLKWVAVAYADHQTAQSPAVQDILNAATETGCAGFLIDTYSKSGPSILSLMSSTELHSVANQCHACGMFLALAGRLSIRDLERLEPGVADIIAIRSAACRNSDRTDGIDATSVRHFRTAMDERFQVSRQATVPPLMPAN